MKFTESCKAMLEQILKENNLDTIEIALMEEEDGSISINLGLVDSKESEHIREIDGLKVEIEDEAYEALEEAIFDVKGDELTIELGHHHHCCCEDDDCECHHEEGEHCCCEGDDCECHHEHEHCCCEEHAE